MTKNPTKQSELSPVQERNTFRLALAVAVSTGLVSIYYFLPSTGARVSFFSANIQLALLSLVGSFAALLASRGRAKAASVLILSAASFSLVMMSLKTSGLDILFAMLIVAVSFGVSNITLSPADARKAIYTSLVVASYFLFLYFAEPFERTLPVSSNSTTWLITSLFILVFLILMLRQFPSYALRTKLVLVFVFLSSVGVGVSFVFANFNMRNVLEENAEQRLLAGASASAQNIDSFLSYGQDSVSNAATLADLNAYLLIPKKERRGSITETQAQNLLFALKNRNLDIISYAILDSNGNNILDSHTRNIGRSEAVYSYFQIPVRQSGAYTSSLLYLPDNNEPSLFFSAAMNDSMGIPLGVLRVQYHASVLQDIIDTTTGVAGKGSFISLLDENHIVLAHGLNQALIGKFPVAPDDETLDLLKSRYLLPANLPNNTFSLDRNAIEMGLNQFVESPYFSSPAGASDEPTFGAVTQLEKTTWLVAAVQPQEIFLAPAKAQVRLAVTASIIIIVLAGITGLGLAHLLVVPIVRLQTVAQKLSDGDLSVQAAVETEDEIGSLATTFNTMASQLRETISSLEQRIQARTEDLELRTSYLEGSAEVSSAVSSITDPHQLALQVVDLIQERFGLYYTGLFLVDDKDEWAVLQAGTGEAGEKMIARGHRIKIGEGMIGWSIARAESRIALDVGEDAVRFDNPDLPETRSEGALPLRSRGRVLGALTVQSAEEAAFDQNIITALQTMADQIAVALDNAELLTQSEEALDAERKAYGEIGQKSWRALTQSQAVPRYLVTAEGDMHPVLEPQPTEVSQALHNDQIIQSDGLTAILPIKSRGSVVGGIKIRKNAGGEAWTGEQVALAETLSEQLSVALESARLYDQSQRKAEREAVISDIAAKVGASMRMDTILRTTVQELGQALGSPEVTFELTDPKKDKTS